MSFIVPFQCHYSVKKSASFLGIGSDNVIAVKCEENGKMIPEELEKAIEQCKSDVSRNIPYSSE